jgi:hypothetical protein
MKRSPGETSPAKSLLEELQFLRQRFRETLKRYGTEVDAAIVQVREAVAAEGTRERLPAGRLHDIRDMHGLLRRLDVKPDKGRRRDLKKIESTVEELVRFTEQW